MLSNSMLSDFILSLQKSRPELPKSVVKKIQVGIWIQSSPKLFAIEWETITFNARLSVDRGRKTIDIYEKFSPTSNYFITIKFSNVRNIYISRTFEPYVCLELFNPFSICCIHKNIRQLRTCINERHKQICPYAFQLRLELTKQDDLSLFLNLCNKAKLIRPQVLPYTPERRNLYDKVKLENLRSRWRQFFPWSFIYYLEGALRDGLILIDDFEARSWREITSIYIDHPKESEFLLRSFIQEYRLNSWAEGHVDITQLENHLRESLQDTTQKPRFWSLYNNEGSGCRYVAFTPTRMLLDGPYPHQSNRILRRWDKYSENFIRVGFRDEDWLHYQQGRKVDSNHLLEERVGAILKDGFDLCGKYFDFLAYSSSSLRDHDVWFMTPFHDPDSGWVDAVRIRREAGDFSGDLIYPARFAARLAQAFTSTDPSIRLHRSEWRIIPDLGTKPYLHTDGVGTISRELASKIWEKLCEANPRFQFRVPPSAYQIRFLGFKGVVAIDDILKGTQMCLRESMKKFEVHDDEYSEIEIAGSFHSPATMFLNRPLIMLLEGLGVEQRGFMDLLKEVVSEVYRSTEDINSLVQVLRRHSLGIPFGFTNLLSRLSKKYKLNISQEIIMRSLRTNFINNIINTSTAYIFRELKHRCRIPVPNSWCLVGVADEGPAYVVQGKLDGEDVFILKEGQIFACVQENPGAERYYVKGYCNISRSPSVNPGDVQRVYAIGKPPDDKICAFRNLVNVAVLPSIGIRSLASYLGGGDLDGDKYDICQHSQLIIDDNRKPADFPPADRWEIDVENLRSLDRTGRAVLDQEKAIPFVCDFIVKYIASDVLGTLSNMHLRMADWYKEGIHHEDCINIAKLCNQAVDFGKNGNSVDINKAPRLPTTKKPDWMKGEYYDAEVSLDQFYESGRAIGMIYRFIDSLRPSSNEGEGHRITYSSIGSTLGPIVREKIGQGIQSSSRERILSMFEMFKSELQHIYVSCTPTGVSTQQLSEEEIVLGLIAAKCPQRRWRDERIYRMRQQTSILGDRVRKKMVPMKFAEMGITEIRKSLEFSWECWEMVDTRLENGSEKDAFGLNSFGFVALNVVLDCLEHLERRLLKESG